MKEINDISLGRMTNGAHFTFVTNILARAEADSAVMNKAAEEVAAFKAAVDKEDEVLKVSQGSQDSRTAHQGLQNQRCRPA